MIALDLFKGILFSGGVFIGAVALVAVSVYAAVRVFFACEDAVNTVKNKL